jgi:hypothetical protein
MRKTGLVGDMVLVVVFVMVMEGKSLGFYFDKVGIGGLLRRLKCVLLLRHPSQSGWSPWLYIVSNLSHCVRTALGPV